MPYLLNKVEPNNLDITPPLSVILPQSLQIPGLSILSLKHRSITSFGFFLLMNTVYSVSRPHVNDFKIPLSFQYYYFGYIAVFLLNTVVKNWATCSLGGILANIFQISHFRLMSDSSIVFFLQVFGMFQESYKFFDQWMIKLSL